MRKTWRASWAVVSAFAVESVVFGLAALPAVVLWEWHLRWEVSPAWVRIVVMAMSLVPAYLVFAVALMLLSASAMRLLGWRTPAGAEWRIADLEWPLLRWGCYLVSTHLVRVFAGALLRATPLWTMYLRWNGARVGRRVFVNSLQVMDHDLLEFGDGVVIGSAAHLSGHTVEHGVVKTGAVRLGRNVTIGVGSVIGIDVEIGEETQVGALSVVPKHQRLAPRAIYAGAPVRRIDQQEEFTTMTRQTTTYGMSVEVALPYEAAVERTRAELAKEGFGVLTEIDVRETLKRKLDVDFRPYVILGACNPPLAHQALTAERDIGLLLPCNVIVYAGERPGRSVVAALDPVVQLRLTGKAALEPLAREVRARLERVLAAASAGS